MSLFHSPNSVSYLYTARETFPKQYYIYILHHTPSTRFRTDRDYRSFYGRNTSSRKIRVFPTEEMHIHDFIFIEAHTGHKIWSDRFNYVQRYQYPFLTELKQHKPQAKTLQQLAFFALSTNDLAHANNLLKL